MIFKKIFLITFFLFSIILSNTLQAESITFGSSIYEGEIKKGKAHGKGILTFSDDTTYEGNFKKNRPHGLGIYTDARENTYEGKWRNGKLKVKLDKKCIQKGISPPLLTAHQFIIDQEKSKIQSNMEYV